MNRPLGWHQEINVQVDSTPQEREFGFGMEFNSILEFTISITDGFTTASKRYFWYNGKAASINESLRLAFQAFLNKQIFNTDHKIWDVDTRNYPSRSKLKTYFVCENEFLSQIFSEMFPDYEMIENQLVLN